MPCFCPLKPYRSAEKNQNGKYSLTWNPKKSNGMEIQEIPCGQCIGCRLERSRQWAVRCMHEASQHENNSFITLTYSDPYLPVGGTLVKRHFQKFMKRLRKNSKTKMRYFHCGEYGETRGRPHYHAAIFGFDFPDKFLVEPSKSGEPQWDSKLLQDCWKMGRTRIGTLNSESAAYIARYIVKKIFGQSADHHYNFVDPHTGEIIQRIPEYTTMSRKPGIAKKWLEKFMTDVYPIDFVLLKKKDGSWIKSKPPKYYDCQYELLYGSQALEEVKFNRQELARLRWEDNIPNRLQVKQKIAQLHARKLVRQLEEEHPE